MDDRIKIYHITRTDDGGGYDTYSDAIVTAKTELEARHFSIESHHFRHASNRRWAKAHPESYSWTAWENVHAELVGYAADNVKRGVCLCASFHAG